LSGSRVRVPDGLTLVERAAYGFGGLLILLGVIPFADGVQLGLTSHARRNVPKTRPVMNQFAARYAIAAIV
jgi:hypothetical protein